MSNLFRASQKTLVVIVFTVLVVFVVGFVWSVTVTRKVVDPVSTDEQNMEKAKQAYLEDTRGLPSATEEQKQAYLKDSAKIKPISPEVLKAAQEAYLKDTAQP